MVLYIKYLPSRLHMDKTKDCHKNSDCKTWIKHVQKMPNCSRIFMYESRERKAKTQMDCEEGSDPGQWQRSLLNITIPPPEQSSLLKGLKVGSSATFIFLQGAPQTFKQILCQVNKAVRAFHLQKMIEAKTKTIELPTWSIFLDKILHLQNCKKDFGGDWGGQQEEELNFTHNKCKITKSFIEHFWNAGILPCNSSDLGNYGKTHLLWNTKPPIHS